ncbi:hypothetical protein T492DRAFT_839857 [Pavlovales sp. CCMP2436]|nr:hypothetical protein T492DRAFT_839857 [Pavlovales sp. CCMP2436]
MSFVSNSNFAQDELRKYRKLLEERVLPRQTQRMVDKKVSQLVKAKQYIYNEHDIAKMVDKNLQDKVVVGSNAIRRAELAELREAALEKKDETELNKFDGLLGELDERAVETRR